ncbi:glycogen debranching N-terminal domain-containing protein [Micromonospora sp. NPDC047738]|uniref:amylo-alpha-1,6-glucosidase n=1 Tax=unclassified Micromonospora TaxID=2617518 RepID=UPI0033E3E862
MDPKLVSTVDGNTYILSDNRGDMSADAGVATGLYSFDTRFLNQWALSVDGKRLNLLAVDELNFFETRFFLVPGAATHYVDATVSVIRHRSIEGTFNEQLIVLNHDKSPVTMRVRIDIGNDFADTVELRRDGGGPRQGRTSVRVDNDGLRLTYERESFVRETIVTSSEPAAVDERGMTFEVTIGPHGSWRTTLRVDAVLRGAHGRDVRANLASHRGRKRPEMRRELEEWLDSAPDLRTDSASLAVTYRRSLIDLGALRYSTWTYRERLPMAGMPWYMTLIARDALISCLQAISFTPQLSVPTLRLCAVGHGTLPNDFREEDPGKVFYEVRYGESAAFEEQPQAADFSAADTTLLFVVLLDEYERWTSDESLVRELEYETRMALAWIDQYADLTGRGYVAYQRRNQRCGVINQGWKNTPDGISYRDGRLPGYPLATCELQGYAYDAKLRGARLARQVWDDPAYADRLEREAADLKDRFNRDFWIADRGYYAVALEADGTQVDGLTSNIGHLLWSGIATEEKAAQVAEHLMSDRLYSGWGIRTLATDNHRYNPIGTHTGMVWPFDNALIAYGLRRYGHDREAARVAEGILTAASCFDGRLPGAFAGYGRSLTRYPVTLPRIGSPQAISASAPLMLLRTLLGVEPCEGHLSVEPAVPETIGLVELLGVPGPWGRLDAVAHGRLPVPG